MSHRILAAATLVAALVLSGCFLSRSLFERERIWDPAWFGRYEAEGVMFVVLPDDPSKRTYLVGSFENGATKVDSYRVALYPGWGNTTIIGSIALDKNDSLAVYTLLKAVGPTRFTSEWPDCSADFALAHKLPREKETCTFTTLDALRAALKSYADETAAKPRENGTLEPQIIERRRDRPLSTIGVMARPSVMSTSEGVHGALTLLDVPANSPAAQAGLKRGDVIYAVGDPRPAVGEELLLRIAAAPPGTTLQISYFDGRSKAKGQASVKTRAIEVSGD